MCSPLEISKTNTPEFIFCAVLPLQTAHILCCFAPSNSIYTPSDVSQTNNLNLRCMLFCPFKQHTYTLVCQQNQRSNFECRWLCICAEALIQPTTCALRLRSAKPTLPSASLVLFCPFKQHTHPFFGSTKRSFALFCRGDTLLFMHRQHHTKKFRLKSPLLHQQHWAKFAPCASRMHCRISRRHPQI